MKWSVSDSGRISYLDPQPVLSIMSEEDGEWPLDVAHLPVVLEEEVPGPDEHPRLAVEREVDGGVSR